VKTQIRIDIRDFVAELMAEEVQIENEESLFALSRKGYSVGQIARLTLAARLNGLAPEDILPTDKLMLYTGARRAVAKKHVDRMLAEQPGVREFIGRSIGDDEDEGYTQTTSPEGLRLALAYLKNRVPGHVVNHLKVVRANGGDVAAARQQAVQAIWDATQFLVADEEAVVRAEIEEPVPA
jgi:hypothetical protein